MSHSQHGGSRPPIREDDGRLIRKMANGERVTITIKAAHLEALKTKYGRNWQGVIRELIAAHLAAST